MDTVQLQRQMYIVKNWNELNNKTDWELCRELINLLHSQFMFGRDLRHDVTLDVYVSRSSEEACRKIIVLLQTQHCQDSWMWIIMSTAINPSFPESRLSQAAATVCLCVSMCGPTPHKAYLQGRDVDVRCQTEAGFFISCWLCWSVSNGIYSLA